MAVTSHMLRPRTEKTKAEKLAQYHTHKRAGLTEGCAAKGCGDRHPCWHRRDAHQFLRSFGRDDLELL